jgi:hypothetical protein
MRNDNVSIHFMWNVYIYLFNHFSLDQKQSGKSWVSCQFYRRKDPELTEERQETTKSSQGE